MTALAKLLERRAISSADFNIGALETGATNETGISVDPDKLPRTWMPVPITQLTSAIDASWEPKNGGDAN